MTNLDIQSAYLGLDPVDRVYLGTDVIYPAKLAYLKTPFTIESIDFMDLKFRFSTSGLGPGNIMMLYRVNDGEWSDIYDNVPLPERDVTYTITSLTPGDTIQFKGYNEYGLYGFTFINNSGSRLKLYGNINSLLNDSDYPEMTDISSYETQNTADGLTYGAFAGIFHLNDNIMLEGIANAENLILPAETIGTRSYYQMFINQEYLGYGESFAAPTIMATTLGASACTDMFKNCRSMRYSPYFSPTTLSEGCCRNMFAGCAMLTASPILGAQTLVSNCYYGMFSGCSSLSEITCLATTNVPTAGTQTQYTGNWVAGVPTGSARIFRKHSNATWFKPSSSFNDRKNSIPQGWTVQDYVEPNS